ncbi:MAG: steroid Delta-isomerase [Oceanococcus sp.]
MLSSVNETEDMPTEEQMRSAMQAYIDALNADDLQGIVDLYAEDATVEDPVGGEPKVGKAAITEFYTGSVQLQPRAKLLAPIRASHGNSAAMAFDVALTLKSGPVVIRAIDVMTFNDQGEFTSMKAYWGPSDMLPG